MKSDKQQLLQSIPSVSSLLEYEDVEHWLERTPRAVVLEALRGAVDAVRADIMAGEVREHPTVENLLEDAGELIREATTPSLRRVINATGIVLHTGLGRAPLCEAAIDAIADGASGYCNLEFDLETGKRGRRMDHIQGRITRLTGAEAALVVNNNAAATLMTLGAFAAGREVIVSRGQLIEIGGSYRLPDIMRASGAILREVGTTNRTRLSDYSRAICDTTAMLLRVHTSNYRVIGFTEEVHTSQLVSLARHHNLLVLDDLGSGSMIDLAELGLAHEPTVAQSIDAGADLVCFSGDKLLGGPQCGIILGREELIKQLEASPLTRTYRPDKLVLLALEATLAQYDDVEHACESVPTLSMLCAETDELAALGQVLCDALSAAVPDESFLVCSSIGFAGGGSLPEQEFETVVVQWRPSFDSAAHAVAALRCASVPVVASIRDEAVCFDVRTIAETDVDPLVQAVAYAAEHSGE